MCTQEWTTLISAPGLLGSMVWNSPGTCLQKLLGGKLKDGPQGAHSQY